jgi:amidase
MDRRTFLQSAGAAAVLTRAAPGQSPDIEEITIADLARMSAREATERYLGRIRELDGKLRSVIEINPDALAIAAELDRGPKKGPLHGVPGVHQGQYRYRGPHEDHRRIARLATPG